MTPLADVAGPDAWTDGRIMMLVGASTFLIFVAAFLLLSLWEFLRRRR